MRTFAERDPKPTFAVVAEPTGVRAVLAHRGIAAGVLQFRGLAAHSSLQGQRSALHDLVRWGGQALTLAETLDAQAPGPSGISGVRFNLGKIDGGEKSNVVAGLATARFGLRPPPELSPRDAMQQFAALAPDALFTEAFSGPPLPHTPELGAAAREHAARYGLPLAEPVAFWTEASVLSAHGIPAVVLGPGDIALAHGPDEYVRLAELEAAATIYRAMLEADA
jgi:acetylornithine deacetylase